MAIGPAAETVLATVRDLRIGGATVGELADGAVRYAPLAAGSSTLKATSPFAVPGVSTLLGRLLGHVQARDGVLELRGITLSDSYERYAANVASSVATLPGKLSAAALHDGRRAAAMVADLPRTLAANEDLFIATGDGVVHASPEASGLLAHVAATPDAAPTETVPLVQLLEHELTHVRRPARIGDPHDVEEAVADALATWGTTVPDTVRAIGFEAPGSTAAIDNAWLDAGRGLQQLLRAGGLDPTRQADRQAAFHLLRDTTVDQVPARVADFLVAHGAIPAGTRDTVAASILAAGSDGTAWRSILA